MRNKKNEIDNIDVNNVFGRKFIKWIAARFFLVAVYEFVCKREILLFQWCEARLRVGCYVRTSRKWIAWDKNKQENKSESIAQNHIHIKLILFTLLILDPFLSLTHSLSASFNHWNIQNNTTKNEQIVNKNSWAMKKSTKFTEQIRTVCTQFFSSSSSSSSTFNFILPFTLFSTICKNNFSFGI